MDLCINLRRHRHRTQRTERERQIPGAPAEQKASGLLTSSRSRVAKSVPSAPASVFEVGSCLLIIIDMRVSIN
jgi:hypothetical protein